MESKEKIKPEKTYGGKNAEESVCQIRSLMRDLIICGHGIHSAEMAIIVERINAIKKTWNLLGFISNAGVLNDETIHGRKNIGTKENIIDYPGAWFVPSNEFKGIELLPRDRTACLIDPSCFIAGEVKMGKGCVLYPQGFVGQGTHIGDFVFALPAAIINHDCRIGNRTIFASQVCLAGYVSIGEECYMGQSSTVKQFVKIGSYSTIGMGSVVLKDVDSESVMAGNPASLLKKEKHSR